MKRIFSLLLCFIVLASAAGCSKGKENIPVDDQDISSGAVDTPNTDGGNPASDTNGNSTIAGDQGSASGDTGAGGNGNPSSNEASGNAQGDQPVKDAPPVLPNDDQILGEDDPPASGDDNDYTAPGTTQATLAPTKPSVPTAATTKQTQATPTLSPTQTVPTSTQTTKATQASTVPTTTTTVPVSSHNQELYARDAQRAAELGQTFINNYYDVNNHYLKLYFYQDDPATAWEYGSFLGLQNKLTKLDPSVNNLSLLNNIFYGLNYYGSMRNDNFWAYVVDRSDTVNGAPDTKYAYDDNAWIAMELTRAYETTGNQTYLQRAETLMNNLLIGEAWFQPVGGFMWDYRQEALGCSCTSNETVKEFLDLYKCTKNSYYLDWAKKVYDWMDSNLRDRNKNVYYNQVFYNQNGGGWYERIDSAYWAYNTGTAISAAASLYNVTKNQRYLNDAKALAKGAYNTFGNKNVLSGYVDFLYSPNGGNNGNVWQSTLLLQGFIDLYPYDPSTTMTYIQAFQKGIDYAYDHYNYSGLLPRDWIAGWTDDAFSALDQSANAQIYAQLALFFK